MSSKIRVGERSSTLVRWTPPAPAIETVNLGAWGGANPVGHSDYNSPGLNDLGWASVSTNFNNGVTNPNPRVLLIDPTGNIFVVAEANGSEFANFRQARGTSTLGTSLNNLNRVSFVAQVDSENTNHIYVGDTSGDAPRLAIDEDIEFTDGRRFAVNGFANDVSDHGVNSLNDQGEIIVAAFGTLYDENDTVIASSIRAVFVASPAPGLEPGNPIIPALRTRCRASAGDSGTVSASMT